MEIEAGQIRSHRLRAHHLDQKLPPRGLTDAAGACGVQNSPPGAWETALFNRLEGCSLSLLHGALYREKILLQAWSFRGAPVVFPTAESGVFLSPLMARPGEQPWIYTRGLAAALDFLSLTFDDLLPLVREAARSLDGRTVVSKEALDRTLADWVRPALPREKWPLWDAPSMYGSPDRQTVGGAAVSFLLRPCAFSSLVVFGERQGASPAFTSFRSWTGRDPEDRPDGGRELLRRFLHCYGPSTPAAFMRWLGCSPRQARRLWDGGAEELEPVRALGKPCFILSADRASFLSAPGAGDPLALLGPHDPYLDLQDRAVVLEDRARHAAVWKTVANPGAILRGGRVAGTWTARSRSGGLEIAMSVWERLSPAEERALERLAEEYAAFRLSPLRVCALSRA